ncbi:NF038122 family metalloprotease [Nostoc sp. TCL26-01]|uniref:NF038122 family metalloprotease n=1 Tax=Nostoc sp. TCL26-01 TaxID=2576904 RepID=UPI0015BDC457|nr:NF038122 family metalloprotease [Nostoc sp. TCL26-01]QLE55149.1 hypothetical protein FD725_06265 [Nostoc sp. TCL26-01]
MSELDLIVSPLTVPTSIALNESFDVSWIVRNLGNGFVSDNNWYDSIYVSDDEIFDTSDININDIYAGSYPAITAAGSSGDSYVVSTNVTLPYYIRPGDRFLLFVADSYNEQSESNETNNVASVAITIPGPDLVVSNLSIPSLTVGQNVTVNWTITNQGNAATTSNYWYDRFVFSLDDVIGNSDDIYAGDFYNNHNILAAQDPNDPNQTNNSYSGSNNIDVSSGVNSSYKLFMVSDINNYQAESNKDNNSRSTSITVSGSDLVINTAPIAPATAVVNSNITVNWTVTNQGTIATSASYWYNRVVLSRDTQYGNSDDITLSESYEYYSPIAANGGTVNAGGTFSLTSNAVGTYNLFVVADIYNYQPETNDANNVSLATQITIAAPDLVVSNVTVPANAGVGESVNITWTVANQGTVATTQNYWYDNFVLSLDDQLGNSDDILLAQNYRYHNGLAAVGNSGNSYQDSINLTLPNSINAIGNYNLFVVADGIYNYQGESDETNNSAISATKINISAPNLLVSNITAPTTITQGSGFDVSWTVNNDSTSRAVADWRDRLYLSTDNIWDSSDRQLDSVDINSQTPLNGATSYTINRTNLKLSGVTDGTYYLIVKTDEANSQAETNEDDNSLALQVTVNSADLRSDSVAAVDSENNLLDSVEFGQAFNVNWSVTNIGIGAANTTWNDRIYLSTDTILSSDDVAVFTKGQTKNLTSNGNYLDSATVTVDFNNPLPTDANGYVSESEPNDAIAQALDLQQNFVPTAGTNSYLVKAKGTVSTSFEGDYYRIYASPGDQLRLYEYGFDTYLYLYNRNGTLLAADDDSGGSLNSLINYTFASNAYAGDYYVRAAGYSSRTGNYGLDITLQTSQPIITGNLAPGNYYLLLKTDSDNTFPESVETNNVVAATSPITLTAISRPDLAIAGSTSAQNVYIDSTVTVSWTVTNLSTIDAARAGWFDSVYLSNDNVFDNSDIALASISRATGEPDLAPGGSYSRDVNITLPTGVTGNKYLIFITDRTNNRLESNETNNQSLVAINIVAPDLVVTAPVTAPTIASKAQTIDVSWQVKNQGTTATNTFWYDRVYLSSNTTLDNGDIFISDHYNTTPLAVNETYSATQSIIIPNSASLGAQYLLFVADGYNYQKEVNNDNNVFATAITINAPDLTISQTTAPDFASIGQNVNISWQVTNQGDGVANGDHYDYVYLSTNTTLDGGDTLVYSEYVTTDLASGGNYTISNKNFILPNTATGDRYLLFVTDGSGSQGETNENNNLTFKAFNARFNSSDLTVIGTPTAPSTISLGETVNVSWQVKNQGQEAATADRIERVYISDNATLDAGDTLLNQITVTTDLGIGETSTNNQSFEVPLTGTGDRYLLFVTDATNTQAEVDETNNVTAKAVRVNAADLQINSFTTPVSGVFGSDIDITWAINNAGEGNTTKAWRDRLYLSPTNTIGNDAILLSDLPGTSLTTTQTYQRSASITLPLNVNLAAGNYYLILKTDADSTQPESLENNNTQFRQIALTEPPLPDLVVSNITAPSTEFSGRKVQVSWTITNQGTAATTGTWYDNLYASSDNQPGNDTFFGSYIYTGTLAPGQSIIRSQEITLPFDWSGDRYFVVTTDSNNQVYEHNKEGNNTAIASQPLTVQLDNFPNLVVSSITPPTLAFSGLGTEVVWTVKNQGNAATNSPYWRDDVWLSRDSVLDTQGDYFLGSVTNPTYLGINESYTSRLNVALPRDISGDWRFIIRTDAYGNVNEYPNDGDNTLSASTITNVELTPPADLRVTNITLAPTRPFSGQQATITWRVTNTGTGATPPDQTRWNDEIIMTENADGTGELFVLGTYQRQGSLAPGAFYDRTQTVNLPIGKWGNYFFAVRTDRNNQVFESAFENNNTLVLDADLNDAGPTPSTVLLTPPPDLVVDNITVPANIVAGQLLTVRYRVVNEGLTATPGSTSQWTDAVYLSPTAAFNSSTAIALGTVNRQGILDTQGSYDINTTFQVPNDLAEGNYYLIVLADAYNRLFEQDDVDVVQGSNVALPNVLASTTPINVLSRSADLIVSEVTTPQVAANAGSTARLSWTVRNIGAGATPVSQWRDRLVASVNTTLGDADDVLLATFERTGSLGVNGTYTRTEDVLIPFVLNTGTYNLFVTTDADNVVYESLNTNNVNSASFLVNRQTPDLAVIAASAASSASSGNPLAVSWTVKNIGAGATNVDYWYDEVYLSADTTINSGDLFLGSVRRGGILAANDTYTVTTSFGLPINLQGNYNVIVRTDNTSRYGEPSNRVIEISETNNTAIASPTTTIILSPVADLQVTQVTAPISAISGQTFALNWQVKNLGAAATGDRTWTDSFYFSADQVFDRYTDTYLGGRNYTGNLGVGAVYNGSQILNVPRGLAGNYYVFVVTDVNNTVEERTNETNNFSLSATPTQVIIPPPSDLRPVANSITLPTSGVVGQPLTIGYTVENIGSSAAIGSWSDTVYLSQDTVWDVNDLAVGTYTRSGDLASGATYNGSVTSNLPGVVPGNYYALIRSDSRNQAPESNKTNNTVTSLGRINVDVPVLNIGGTVSGTLGAGQATYYKLQATAGQAIRLHFDSADNTSTNQVYVRYGEMPTRGQFDVTDNEPFTPDPDFVLPATQTGTYYILAYGNTATATPNYTLTATEIPFSVFDVSSDVVGNDGIATIKIDGAKFGSNTTFELIDSQGNAIAQTTSRTQNTTTAFATFNLTDKAIGSYSLRATQGSEIVTLANAIQVQQGDLIDDFSTNITGPRAVWAGQKYPINIAYGNAGDSDITAPLLLVRTVNNNAAIGYTPRYNASEAAGQTLQLLGAGRDLGLTQLRPGESYTLPVFYTHLGGDESAGLEVVPISRYDSTAISASDWTMLRDTAKPTSVTNTDWQNFWQAKQSGIGNTWGDYVELVTELSTAYSGTSNPITDVQDLFSRWYSDQAGVYNFQPKSTISGRLLGPDGTPLQEVRLDVVRVLADGTRVGVQNSTDIITDLNGRFTFQGLEAGNYEVTQGGSNLSLTFLPTTDGLTDLTPGHLSYGFTVASGQNQNNLDIQTYQPSNPDFIADRQVGQKQVSLVRDANGVSHVFWVEDNQLWHSYFNGSQWIDAAPISAAQPAGTYKVQASSALLGGNAGLIVTWDERTDDPNNPVNGDTEVFYALGRVKAGGGYEWSNQIAVTQNDNVVGAAPTLLVDSAGNPFFVYQQYDGNVENDDTDLYYQQRNLSGDTITWDIGSGQNGSISWSYAAGAEINLPDALGRFIPVTHIKISGQYSGSSVTSCDQTVIQGGWSGRIDVSNKGNIGNVRDPKGKGEFKVTASGGGSYGAVYKKTVGMTQKRSQAGGNLGFETTVVPSFLGPVANVLRAAQSVVSWFGGDLETGINGGGGVNRVNLQSPTGWRENWGVNVNAGIYGKLKFGTTNGLWSAKPPTFFEFKLTGGVTGSLSLTTGSSETARVGRITGRVGARAVAELKVGQFSLGPIKFEPIILSAGIEGFISFPDCNAVWDVWSTPLTAASSQPTIGTTTIYGSNAILSGVGSDVYNDSSAVLTKGQNGLTYTAWSKQFYDVNAGAGEAVTVATFDGTNWSDPVTLVRNAMLRGLDISTAANGRPLALWSMADETAFVLPQDPSTIDSIEEVAALTQAVANSTNLFYATVDAAGNWSAPVRLANLNGIDQGVKLGQTSDGKTIATWTNTNGTVTTLQTAFWNGTSWTTPTAIATGNLAAPSVGQLGSQTSIFWSQLQPVQGSTESEEVLFYSLLDNATGQWTTPSLFTPVLAGGQGSNLSENPSDVISLLGEDRFAPPPEGCEPPYNPPRLRSADPNDILGPVGFGAENWVTPTEPFGYTIRFENMATATAPAKLVTVTQQLDPDLDWRSFRLESFSWGDIIVEIPENRSFYSERLDVREQYGVYVDFTAFIDITTGIASWELRAIDPATGSLPTDPLLGFLPPNGTTAEDKGRGEGYVAYSIKSKRNVTHGARIDAEAEIIFDNNEPIKTPAIFNTIDAIKPTATIQPLPANVVGDTFTVNWGGSDNAGGSGLAYYDIYMSVNDGAYELLLGKTTQTEVTITGDLGSKYNFIAVGKDNAQSLFCYRCEGLVDPDAPTLESTPQASIVLGTAGEIAFSQTQFQVNESGGAIAAVTLTRTGGSFGEVSVTLTPSNGSAIGGNQPFAPGIDFNNQPLVVTFANGEQSKIVNLPINADNLIEGAETLTLALGNVTGGATLGSQTTASLTIVDDTSQIAFADTSFRLGEGATNYIQLVRTGSTANAVSATLTFTNGTATGNSDFDNSDITVNFAANETSKTIAIPVTDDAIAEGIETFNLSLSNPTGGAALGSVSSAIATIVDNDTNLKLNLTADAGMSAQVVAAFTQAANRWATLLNNDVTLNLNIAFRDMGTATVGQTSSLRNNFTYTEVRNALIAKGSSADDSLAIANLPTGNALNLLLNRTTNSPYGSASPTSYLDNDGDANNTTVRLNRANAKALGLIAADNANPDATIIFNSNAVVNWDFDPSNGISEGAFDFVGMATHEFAHALGFDSGVDVLDTNPPTTDDKLTFVSTLDLFRFSTISYGYGAGTIDWTANNTDKYFSLNGGATKIASFATGRTYGDGYQPSHWKDGLNLGLMNPTTETGAGLQISTLDLRALDVIGWNLSNPASGNAPTDLSLSASSVNENQAIATVIGTFTSTDPDPNNTFTYTLVQGTGDNDNTAFTIVGNELRLAIVPDYETKDSYSIRVQTKDQGGLSYEKVLAIAINNINEAPTDLVISAANIDENKAIGTAIGNFTTTDPDAPKTAQTFTYSLVTGAGDTDNSLFTIEGNQLKANAVFDYETKTSYSIRVQTTDQDGLSYAKQIAIAINNINDQTGTPGNDILQGTANDDQINGLGGNDQLFGLAGNDILDGGTGKDTMTGGLGDDIYIVDNSADKTVENANEGIDTVRSSISYTLSNHVENLVLTGTSNLSAIGNDLNNQITGNSGNNTLDGKAGDDTLSGGLGNDTYIVDSVADVVTENANEGTDSVTASVTYTLSNHVERLTLSGTNNINGTGNSLNNTITGNSGNNTLIGGAGNDSLSGAAGNDILNGGAGNDSLNGGTGDDTLIGGTGDDSYNVDSVADVVTENLNEGTDSVTASVTYTLSDNVEKLTLTGTANINGTGNSLNNTITGNAGNNTLIGGAGNDSLSGGVGNDILNGGAGNDSLNGGTGDDTLIGGTGDDSYNVDSVADVVTENLNEGTDSVTAAITYTLSDNVEKLTLTGTANIDGTGNSLNNTITGNAGNNTLIGGAGNDSLSGNAGNDILNGGAGNDSLNGGTGDDTLIGGVGDDSYNVDSLADVVTENANEGTDSVTASVTYTLTDNVEKLTLTGTANIDGIGNSLNNTITGNAGNNTLIGGAGNDSLSGGVGNDTLIGGLGDDSYTVDSVGDVVTENANEGTDTITASVSYTLSDNVEKLTLTGTANIDGTGNSLNNTITGNAGNNTLTGSIGNDSLSGGTGDDTLDGGTGTDTLVGGSGNDILVGGFGSDRLIGGTGNDKFVFTSLGEGIDTITDFSSADDVLVVQTLLTNLNYTGTKPITDGYIRGIQSGANTLIQIDTDGFGTSASFSTLVTLNNFNANNFSQNNLIS